VIGHLKAEHRMGRNHLAHRAGDAINAMLAVVGYNFHLLLNWVRLFLRAILVALLGPFRLRQSYLRITKHAAMMAGRYAHAKQFNRHRKQLRILRSRLGRIIRNISRKIAGRPALEEVFAWPLARASQIRSQQQRQRGWKLYSFHAPEVECIGKGKASAPYEFEMKVSVVTTNSRAPGGQFVLGARALPGNPYDGHTLKEAFEDTERLTGCTIKAHLCRQGLSRPRRRQPVRVFISGHKRGVFGVIKRELRRRSAIEAVIAT
jgi:IS5 family transposase